MKSSISRPLILTLLIFLSCSFLVESTVQTRLPPPQRKPPIPRQPATKSKTALYYAAFEKQEFLSAHNKIRYLNKEKPFIWDLKLALYAKKYFSQRYNDCAMIHSTGPYGENLFWGSGKTWRPTNAVRVWADEMRYYNMKSNTCEEGKMCGHYTQIVWKESVRLGCFRGACKNGNTFIICEYDPPGNYVGEKPF